MNVLCINGHILDLDEVVSKVEQIGYVQLTFKNGDMVPLHWRDDVEKRDILGVLPRLPVVS